MMRIDHVGLSDRTTAADQSPNSRIPLHKSVRIGKNIIYPIQFSRFIGHVRLRLHLWDLEGNIANIFVLIISS